MHWQQYIDRVPASPTMRRHNRKGGVKIL